MPEPRLPTTEWVRVRPVLSGICGSDVATLSAKGSIYLSAFTSFPFVPGHEVVGRVVETGGAVSGFGVGDRVALAATQLAGLRAEGPRRREHPQGLSGRILGGERQLAAEDHRRQKFSATTLVLFVRFV